MTLGLSPWLSVHEPTQHRGAVFGALVRSIAPFSLSLAPVKQGFYLASLAHCMACHSRTSEDVPADFKNAWGKGGRVFKGPFGESTAANISGHKEKGLGGWTDAEIKRALTEGTSKDGRRLKPPMIDYVAYYKTWKDSEIDALTAWIRTIPPIE